MTPRDVGGVIQQDGTMLGSARCPEFLLEETGGEQLMPSLATPSTR
jgi:hypothetical protein